MIRTEKYVERDSRFQVQRSQNHKRNNDATLAQLVEHRFCKPKVRGSNPRGGSIMGRYSSGQRGQTVNLLAFAFGGSSPPRPTIKNIPQGMFFCNDKKLPTRLPWWIIRFRKSICRRKVAGAFRVTGGEAFSNPLLQPAEYAHGLHRNLEQLPQDRTHKRDQAQTSFEARAPDEA